jgi:hypothetical protein
MAVGHPALQRVVRKREAGITLLSDCLALAAARK